MKTTTIHHQHRGQSQTTCNSTMATTENSTFVAELVTCKRCLSALTKTVLNATPKTTGITANPKTVATLTANPDTPKTTGITANPDTEIECADCGKPIPKDTSKAWDGEVYCGGCLAFLGTDPKAGGSDHDPLEGLPVGQIGNPLSPTTLKDKARVAATSTKPTTVAKVANVHLHHDRVKADAANLNKAGQTKPDTLCAIAGATTTDPALVTCKVCLAKLNGTAPTNAIPTEVKSHRKAFKSFVARASYLAYMDADCAGVWYVQHTNMAGVGYQISGNSGTYTLYEKADLNQEYTAIGEYQGKAEMLEAIEDAEWSCGEDK